MDLEKIRETLDNYNLLLDLVKEKCEVAAEINRKYYLRGAIELLYFCDTAHDYLSVSGGFNYVEIPIIWLTKSNEELAGIVATEKRLKEEEDKKAIDKLIESERLQAEHNERMLYKKLKEKYEPKPINI